MSSAASGALAVLMNSTKRRMSALLASADIVDPGGRMVGGATTWPARRRVGGDVITFVDRRDGAWIPDAARSVGAVRVGEQVEQRAELGRREPAEVLAEGGVDDRGGLVEPLAPGRGEPRGDEAPVVRVAVPLDEPRLRHAVQEPADVRPLRDEA